MFFVESESKDAQNSEKQGSHQVRVFRIEASCHLAAEGAENRSRNVRTLHN